MIQPVIGRGSLSVGNATVTHYTALNMPTSGTTPADVESAMIQAGQMLSAAITVSAAPGVGKSLTYTLQKNGSDTSLVLVLADANTTATSTGTASWAATDRLRWKIVPAGTPTLGTTTRLSYLLNTNDAATSLFFSGNNLLNGTTPRWFAPFNVNLSSTVSITTRSSIVAVAGTITGYAAWITGSLTSGTGYNFTLYKNGTAQDGSGGTPDTRFSLQTAAATDQDSATFSLSVSPGDLISMQVDSIAGPSNRQLGYSLAFSATNPGEIPFCMTLTAIGTATPRYMSCLAYDNAAASGTEANFAMNPNRHIELDQLYVKLGTAPGGSVTRTISARKDSGATTVTCGITASATTGNDVTHKVKINTGNTYDIEFTSSGGTPADSIGIVGLRMTVVGNAGAGGGGNKKAGGGAVSFLGTGGANVINYNPGVDIGITY